MGSTIPSYFEGGPWHADDYVLTFTASSPVTAGQVVVLTGNHTIAPISHSGTNQFLLGVAVTSGTLAAAILVATRGYLGVVADGNITYGNFLGDPTTTDGRVLPMVGPGVTNVVRAIALQSTTTAGATVLALFF